MTAPALQFERVTGEPQNFCDHSMVNIVESIPTFSSGFDRNLLRSSLHGIG